MCGNSIFTRRQENESSASSYNSTLGLTNSTKGPKRAPVWTIAILEPQSTLAENRPAVSIGIGEASRRPAGPFHQTRLPGIRAQRLQGRPETKSYVHKVLSTHSAFRTFPPTGSQEFLLCPVRALKIYIERSASYRKSEQLFVGFGNRAKGGPLRSR